MPAVGLAVFVSLKVTQNFGLHCNVFTAEHLVYNLVPGMVGVNLETFFISERSALPKENPGKTYLRHKNPSKGEVI